MKKILLVVGLALHFYAPSVHAGQQIVSGRWEGQDYLFALNDEWQDVQGSWGRLEYSLAWDQDYLTMSGKTAGSEQSVEFNKVTHQIFSTVSCGWIDFSYTQDAHLTGNVCTHPVDQKFSSEQEMLVWAKGVIFEQVVADFPEPARMPIKMFLLGLAKI